MSITMRVRGFEEAVKRLNDFSVSDRLDLMQDIGAELVSQTEDRFDRSEAPDGSAWAEWADATKKFVARHAPGSQKLWRSGAGGGRLKSRMSALATVDEVAVGSDVAYAAIHQTGGRAGRGKKVEIPARPYLGLSDENVEDIEGIISDWIAEKL